MKHVTYAGKSLLVDDTTADLLMEYARVLALEIGSDTVTARAVGSDGNEVEATFLLNQSTVMVAESTHSSMAAPSNADAADYMRTLIDLRLSPPLVQPEELDRETSATDFDLVQTSGELPNERGK